MKVPLGMEGNALGTRGLGFKLRWVSQLYGRMGWELLALVNIEGEEDMAELEMKPQLHCCLC